LILHGRCKIDGSLSSVQSFAVVEQRALKEGRLATAVQPKTERGIYTTVHRRHATVF
jgi:hypothetical protein